MDIDPILVVPDTPDRVTAQNKKGKSRVENNRSLFISSPSENCDPIDNEVKNRVNFNEKGSRMSFMNAQKTVVGSSFSDCYNKTFSGNSSSLVDSAVPRRRVQSLRNDKLRTQLSACEDCSIVDLTEKNGNTGASKRVNPSGVPGSSQAEGYGKCLWSSSKLPSSHSMKKSLMTPRCMNKGKGPNGTFSDSTNVIESLTETQSRTGKVLSAPSSISSPRVAGQKRLVRNGCISPYNIEKAQQVIRKDKTDSIDGGPQIGIDVRDAVAEGHDFRTQKGKGIMFHPLSVKQPDSQSSHNRSTCTVNEIVKDVGDSNEDSFWGSEELGRWRSTRNRSKKIHLSSSDEQPHFHKERIHSCFVSELPGKEVRQGKMVGGPGISNYSVDQDSASVHSTGHLPRHRVPDFKSQDQITGCHTVANMVTKRQKRGSSSSRLGECSGAPLDDSHMFVDSPGDASKPRSSQTQSQSGLSILEPVIEIDEASPEVRGNGSSSAGRGSDTGDAMARQIEADEMLARELQEQFYSEAPHVGVSEMDAHVALALQHEENSPGTFSRRTQHVFSHRNSLTATNSSRPSLSHSPLLSGRTRQARGSRHSRFVRLRTRFPGRSRTISSRLRNSLFPADMDVDMRMHILEALEAVSEIDVNSNLLQIHHEFNENDYEMLLSLDENNDEHGGASTSQINSLPQSTVQNDNFGEDCAVCLETPTVGDIIRHLPCFHKFHKECIDPWLRRRASCPVCKTSVT